MGIGAGWSLSIGSGGAGPRNLITDVDGVLVGHCTIEQDQARTGVTAVLPHAGNLFTDKVMAAAHVINGFGKSVGLMQVTEMGVIETPLLLTNTLSAGTASNALVKHMLAQNSDIGVTTGTVNPVVLECNDGGINDIRGLHITEEHAAQALQAAASDFAEGAVGAGRGMRCHQLKGGIGSASRRISLGQGSCTVGAVVLSNHGTLHDLTVNGDPIGRRFSPDDSPRDDTGSVIVILATDAPLSERQLERMARRSIVGLSRTGSQMASGSGEIALAFSTANRIPHYPTGDILDLHTVHEDRLDRFFRAAAEAVEESVISSMLHAQPDDARDGTRVRSLADLLEAERGAQSPAAVVDPSSVGKIR